MLLLLLLLMLLCVVSSVSKSFIYFFVPGQTNDAIPAATDNDWLAFGFEHKTFRIGSRLADN
jgi:hypothetical protein